MQFLNEAERFGLVIDKALTPDAVLSAEFVDTAVREHGLCVIRGFALGVDDFRKHTEFLATRWASDDRARHNHPTASGIQTVTLGDFPLNWHAEAGNLPIRADALALYCETPGTGGETLIADGAALWQATSNEAKDYFRAHRLYFTYRMTVPEILGFFGVPPTVPVGPRVIATLIKELDENIDAVLERTSGKLAITWRPRAFSVDPVTGQEVFASNVFLGVYDDSGYVPRVDDGTAIPKKILDEMQRAADATATQLSWAPGDMAVVNNHRCLHARNSPGKGRVLYFTCGLRQSTNERVQGAFMKAINPTSGS